MNREVFYNNIIITEEFLQNEEKKICDYMKNDKDYRKYTIKEIFNSKELSYSLWYARARRLHEIYDMIQKHKIFANKTFNDLLEEKYSIHIENQLAPYDVYNNKFKANIVIEKGKTKAVIRTPYWVQMPDYCEEYVDGCECHWEIENVKLNDFVSSAPEFNYKAIFYYAFQRECYNWFIPYDNKYIDYKDYPDKTKYYYYKDFMKETGFDFSDSTEQLKFTYQ